MKSFFEVKKKKSSVDAMKDTSVDAKHFNSNAENSSLAAASSVSLTKDLSLPVLNAGPLDYYDMKGLKYLFIYNHHTYEDSAYFEKQPSTRHYTYEDVKTLKRVFSKLDFKVNDYHNKQQQFVKDSLKEFCKQNHSNTSCVCVVILTHGGKGGELLANDKSYLFQNILELFEKGDPGLRHKPKLFFVQACRGKLADDGKLVQVDAVGCGREVKKMPTNSDYLILRSTVEDYVSYRGCDGSWMIQALCEMVEKHHEASDIHQIITLMNQKVAVEKISNSDDPNYDKKKQMPETWHTLTKFFKFK